MRVRVSNNEQLASPNSMGGGGGDTNVVDVLIFSSDAIIVKSESVNLGSEILRTCCAPHA